MKVNELAKNFDSFFIKRGNEVLGLQINDFGEHHLTDEFGDCKVLDLGIETHAEVYGNPFVLAPESLCAVLYI